MALLAFDLARRKVDDSFAGFAVQYKPPGSSDPRDPEASLKAGATVGNAISLEPEKHAGVLNVGFTRGSSVLYSAVFLSQLTGAVRTALDDVVNRTLFSYAVVQRTEDLAVQKPDGSTGVVPFAYLGSKAPFPFDREWSGGGGNMVHHKFVVTDFNSASPRVFTGSSNLAAGGEKDNGDRPFRAVGSPCWAPISSRTSTAHGS
jgi:hypothetical protein